MKRPCCLAHLFLLSVIRARGGHWRFKRKISTAGKTKSMTSITFSGTQTTVQATASEREIKVKKRGRGWGSESKRSWKKQKFKRQTNKHE